MTTDEKPSGKLVERLAGMDAFNTFSRRTLPRIAFPIF